MANKVVSIEDLISTLENVKKELLTDNKLLTEEQIKSNIQNAISTGDPKDKILAVHSAMSSSKESAGLTGSIKMLDFLISLFSKYKTNEGT